MTYRYPTVGVAETTPEQRAEIRETQLKRDNIQTVKSMVKPRMIAKIA